MTTDPLTKFSIANGSAPSLCLLVTSRIPSSPSFRAHKSSLDCYAIRYTSIWASKPQIKRGSVERTQNTPGMDGFARLHPLIPLLNVTCLQQSSAVKPYLLGLFVRILSRWNWHMSQKGNQPPPRRPSILGTDASVIFVGC